jgi:hypothetical protein
MCIGPEREMYTGRKEGETCIGPEEGMYIGLEGEEIYIGLEEAMCIRAEGDGIAVRVGRALCFVVNVFGGQHVSWPMFFVVCADKAVFRQR